MTYVEYMTIADPIDHLGGLEHPLGPARCPPVEAQNDRFFPLLDCFGSGSLGAQLGRGTHLPKTVNYLFIVAVPKKATLSKME